MAPKVLAEALKNFPKSNHPDLLVGFNKADDAGVFRISEDMALVQTLDFFPPIVDDPYQFGQIAAANALSDVYAMGGTPVTALNIVCFPEGTMSIDILIDLLRGGNDKIEEAGAVVVGGHSIKDKELKYGVSVTGLINPKHIMTNAGAKAGDRLYLTKPIGTGIITTGIKLNAVSKELTAVVIAQMSQLNKKASEAMANCKASAATDITGFGLLGHAYEMAAASNVSILFHSNIIPIMPEVKELAKMGMIPGGANSNKDYLSDKVHIKSSVEGSIVPVLFDPQTSGGLLISISEDLAELFEQEVRDKKIFALAIGEVLSKTDFSIIVE